MAEYTDSSAELEDDATLGADGAAGGAEGQEGEEPTHKAKPDNEAMAAIKELADIVRTQATPKEKEVELTPEQKAEFWGIYDPAKTDKEFYKKFFRLNPDATPEEAAAMQTMFQDMQKGIVQQSIKGSLVYARKMIQDLVAEHIEPMQQHFSQANQEAVKARFFASYPVLQDEKYAKIIRTVAKSLSNEQFPATPQGEQAFSKALAEGAAEFIKMADANFSLGSQQQKKPGQVPKLPRGSVGGNGNVGGGRQEAAKGTKDDFDSIDVDRKSLLRGSL